MAAHSHSLGHIRRRREHEASTSASPPSFSPVARLLCVCVLVLLLSLSMHTSLFVRLGRGVLMDSPATTSRVPSSPGKLWAEVAPPSPVWGIMTTNNNNTTGRCHHHHHHRHVCHCRFRHSSSSSIIGSRDHGCLSNKNPPVPSFWTCSPPSSSHPS